jgi:ferredoxin
MKQIRIVISGIVLIVFLSCFLFAGDFFNSLLSFIASYQFFPSLIKVIHTGTVTISVILIPIVTILFGRIYCSTICPLGTLQDSSSWLNRNKKYTYRKQNLFFRFAIPLISIILFFFSIPLIIIFIEPYSIVSRAANFFLVSFGNRVNIEVPFLILLVSGIILSLILTLSFFKGRLYCNSICPVGAVLSIFSRIPLFFSFRIDKSKCKSCGKCEKNCKAECIDLKNKTIHSSKCVMCFNCLSICKNNAVKYSANGFEKEKEKEKYNYSRRNFLSLGTISLLTYPVSKLFPQKSKIIPVTPPGSTGLKHFTESCTACQLCVTQCPTGVLRPSFFEYGLTGIMQPHLDFNYNSCDYNCVVCLKACPNGAINPLPLSDKRMISIGNAKIDKNICVVYKNETACAACDEMCPTGATHMIDYKNGLPAPTVNTNMCIGCGACEHACPTKPKKAIIVESFAEHKKIKALPAKGEAVTTDKEKEFAAAFKSQVQLFNKI